jgi:hypothetical protein
MSQASFDASIPVLTEVLKAEPPGDALLSTTADGASSVRPPPAEAAAQLEADAIDGWSAAEWAMMEHRLSVRIMHQLQSRVDFVLEQRIKDSMAEVLTHALHDLTNEIRVGLHDTIEKIVSRAVAQELTHLQAQKK